MTSSKSSAIGLLAMAITGGSPASSSPALTGHQMNTRAKVQKTVGQGFKI